MRAAFPKGRSFFLTMSVPFSVPSTLTKPSTPTHTHTVTSPLPEKFIMQLKTSIMNILKLSYLHLNETISESSDDTEFKYELMMYEKQP